MAKPEKRMYQFTLTRLREALGVDLRADQVLFLDDVGVNLKVAAEVGMKTIKVGLGETEKVAGVVRQIMGFEENGPAKL